MAGQIYDQFKVISKRMINNDDIYSLTRIYLPLMGIDSYALYFGLSCLECDKEYHFKTVLDIMNLKGIKAFNTASSKLEGLGLLNVYEKAKEDGKEYLFEIKRPLNAIEALNEGTLMDLLASQIGKTEVDRLIEENDISVKSYKNVTKKMDEVFSTDTGEKYEFLKKLIPSKNGFVIENKNFNYSLFKYSFDSNFITEEVLEEEEFKDNITRISFAYKLDEDDMNEVVRNALSIEKNLDYASLSKHAKIKFNNKYKTSDIRLITQEDDDYIESIKDDKILSLCNWLESVSPSEVLETINNGGKATTSEVAMACDLMNNTKLPSSVINFLILMVNYEKDGELPGYAYFEKIANTWVRAKVKNVVDAYNYVEKKKAEKQEKLSKTYNPSKKIIKPEWYDKYKEELEKKPEENKALSSEEVKNILATANELFGGNNEQ